MTRGLRAAAVTAVLLYILEVGFLQQLLITLLTAIGAFVVLPVKALIAFLKGEKTTSKSQIAKAGIYALMVIASVTSVGLNNRLATANAERIIAACRRYQSARGHLPKQLEDLVPEFLPRIPVAKVALTFNKFEYFSRGGPTSLMWYSLPPFGRRDYVFEKDRWETLD